MAKGKLSVGAPKPAAKKKESSKWAKVQIEVDRINKTKGLSEFAKVRSGSDIPPVSRIRTGILTLDVVMGGGLPRARFTQFKGAESCLSGDTFIRFEVRSRATGRRVWSKGGTLERLWERFRGEVSPYAKGRKGRHHSAQSRREDVEFYAPSMNHEGRIVSNRVVDVVLTGEKECFLLTTTCGERITATADHRFWNGRQYVHLSDLQPGDRVFVHNNTPFRGRSGAGARRAWVYVKNHPHAVDLEVRSKTRTYRYKKVLRSRLTVEACRNGLSFNAYVDRLNDGDLAGLTFLRSDEHVHHIDENVRNDVIENLLVQSPEEHNRFHARTNHNDLRFVAVEATVARIERAGVLPVYDVSMEAPYHNFVADRFVVHNCFKTTAILHTIASVQANGGTAVYVQGEEFDRAWAAQMGVDLDRLHIISVAEDGGRSLEQLCDLVDTGLIDVAVVDSIQGLTTERELDETEMGASGYGSGGPQMWGQWTRRITRAFNRGAETAVLWTSQLRSQPGKYSPTGDTSDGTQIWALKHAKSVDVLFKKGEVFKDKNTESGPYARTFSVRADKNKTSHPNVSGEFRFYYRDHEGIPRGIDVAREAAILGQSVGGVIRRSGAWYSIDGEKVANGVDNLVLFLRKEEEVLRFVIESIYEGLQTGNAPSSVDPEEESDESSDEEE